MYNFNNNGSEADESGIKTIYLRGKTCWQVISWSRKARWHVNTFLAHRARNLEDSSKSF